MTGRLWTREERRALTDAAKTVSHRLDQWDPILVYDDPEDAPRPGEYDDLVWPVMRLLVDGASVDAIATLLADAVEGYGLSRPPDTTSLAASLKDWWGAEHG